MMRNSNFRSPARSSGTCRSRKRSSIRCGRARLSKGFSSPLRKSSAALDFLKGEENPFESLARPQRMDDRFLDLHVPELLAGERKLLLRIIDRYRVEEYTRAADLPPTRVVTILG